MCLSFGMRKHAASGVGDSANEYTEFQSDPFFGDSSPYLSLHNVESTILERL